jgi:diguanylate cyclase (GGDEF)-like protein
MKIFGARSERSPQASPHAAERRDAGPGEAGNAALLGLSEAELTPSVRGAVETLLGEIDGLRDEVGQLKARLAEMEGLADRDALTPLLNRRAFLRELSRVRTFAERYGAPASLVFFDLDGFKRLNDRLGHAAGDDALRAVAERLQANIRESDVVGRLGGDEFGVILAQADHATAETKARALAQAIEDAPLSFGGALVSLQISYGVRQLGAGAAAEQLLAEADAAMFARKRARRAGS